MIFNISETKNEKLEKVYKESITKLNKFFDLQWTENLPNVFIVPDRKTMDGLYGPTEPWMVAFADHGSNIYLLSPENYERDSIHKYSEESYLKLIPHELSHKYFNAITGGYKPLWLNEGLALYVAGQLNENYKPKKIVSFLEGFNKQSEKIDSESCHVVKYLIDNFSRKKLLELLKKLSKRKVTKESLEKDFKSVYEIELSYEMFNK